MAQEIKKKVYLRLIYTYRAVLLPCRVAKDLDCLSHLNNTVRLCLVNTYRAVLRSLCKRLLKATARYFSQQNYVIKYFISY
jgi:hypothetical protein